MGVGIEDVEEMVRSGIGRVALKVELGIDICFFLILWPLSLQQSPVAIPSLLFQQ